MDNNDLVLRYKTKIYDVPLSELLVQSIIKNENQLMMFYDYIFQYFPYNGRSTRAYIVFYQVEPIDHFTHFPGPVSKYGTESE